MEKLKVPEDQPLEAGLVSKVVEAAQAKIEGFNFDVRKNLLDYDDVMNRHRQVFYQRREKILLANEEELRQMLDSIGRKAGSLEKLRLKEKEWGGQFLAMARFIFLKTLDFYWVLHLEDMAWLRQSVKLKAYGQLNPLVEYKSEAYKIFQEMTAEAEEAFINAILRMEQPKAPLADLTAQAEEKTKVVGSLRKKAPGRNDPCPCGSGKKYKKCCWPKYG
jgi:preprotein translocase subunit SecA